MAALAESSHPQVNLLWVGFRVDTVRNVTYYRADEHVLTKYPLVTICYNLGRW